MVKKNLAKLFNKQNSSVWYDSLVFVVSLILVVVLFVFKADNVGTGHWFLFTYTILITVFQLFRLLAAIIAPRVLDVLENSGSDEEYLPKVTIVIPCKDEEGAIGHTLKKSFAANYPKELLEIIVINDGSTDNTLDEILKVKKEHPELVIIDWKENRGKREGMATGFRMAKGEIVVQIDSDSYIEPSKFRNLITPFSNPIIGAVCAHTDVANADENFITKMQSGYYFIAFRILKGAESALCSVFCCSGCSSAYRKDVVLPILDEWLNEKFMGVIVKHGDDRSLTGFVLRSGHRTIYTHKAQAYTIAPTTVKRLFQQQSRWKKSWISSAFFTFRYIFKTDPFVGIFYFTPLVLISFLTPVVAFGNIYLLSILNLTLPLGYLAGGLTVTLLYMLYASSHVEGKKKYIGHFLAWQLLTITVFCYLIIYSFVTFRNQDWGTR